MVIFHAELASMAWFSSTIDPVSYKLERQVSLPLGVLIDKLIRLLIFNMLDVYSRPSLFYRKSHNVTL